MKAKLLSLAVVGLSGVSAAAVSGTIHSDGADDRRPASDAGSIFGRSAEDQPVFLADVEAGHGRARPDLVRTTNGGGRHAAHIAGGGPGGGSPEAGARYVTPESVGVATDTQVQVPEPSTLGILGLGLAGVAFMRRPRST